MNIYHTHQRNRPNPNGGLAPSRLKKGTILLKRRENLQQHTCNINRITRTTLQIGNLRLHEQPQAGNRTYKLADTPLIFNNAAVRFDRIYE